MPWHLDWHTHIHREREAERYNKHTSTYKPLLSTRTLHIIQRQWCIGTSVCVFSRYKWINNWRFMGSFFLKWKVESIQQLFLAGQVQLLAARSLLCNRFNEVLSYGNHLIDTDAGSLNQIQLMLVWTSARKCRSILHGVQVFQLAARWPQTIWRIDWCVSLYDTSEAFWNQWTLKFRTVIQNTDGKSRWKTERFLMWSSCPGSICPHDLCFVLHFKITWQQQSTFHISTGTQCLIVKHNVDIWSSSRHNLAPDSNIQIRTTSKNHNCMILCNFAT